MKRKISNIIFIAGIFIVMLFLIDSIFYYPQYIKDCIFILLVIGVFYLIQRKYPLPPILVALGMIPLIMHLAGLVFSFFAFFFLGIGYDKILHFVSGTIVTLLLYYWMKGYDNNSHWIKLVMAVMILMGFEAINEIIEFVGTQYLHIYGPSMFSQGDLLPLSLQNDLIKYDTWWDMIFNLFGTIFASIIVGVSSLFQKESKSKKRNRR